MLEDIFQKINARADSGIGTASIRRKTLQTCTKTHLKMKIWQKVWISLEKVDIADDFHALGDFFRIKYVANEGISSGQNDWKHNIINLTYSVTKIVL